MWHVIQGVGFGRLYAPLGLKVVLWHCVHCRVAWKPSSAKPVVAWLKVALPQLVVLWHCWQAVGKLA
jgi:hypothetical protein